MSAEDEESWARHFAEVAEEIEELGADDLDGYILVTYCVYVLGRATPGTLTVISW